MPLGGLILALILVGVALYIITLIPMDPKLLQLIRVLVIVFVCLWVLSYFLPGMGFPGHTFAPCR